MPKIGVDRAEYGKYGEDNKISEIKQLKGLRKAKLDVSQEIENFYADDGVYEILDGGISDLGLEFELADILTEAKSDLLGAPIEDGMEIYNQDIRSPYVAASFRTKMSNGKYVYFGLARGKFSIPSLDAQTKEDKLSAQTDSISGKFAARDDKLMMVIAREDSPSFDLNKFYDRVYGTLPDPIEVTSVSVNPKTTIKTQGTAGEQQFTSLVIPVDAADKEVTFSVAPKPTGLAISTDGKLTWTNAVAVGDYTVTATTKGAKVGTATLTLKTPQ